MDRSINFLCCFDGKLVREIEYTILGQSVQDFVKKMFKKRQKVQFFTCQSVTFGESFLKAVLFMLDIFHGHGG